MLARMSGACLVPFVPRRKPDGKGYQLIMLPPECSPPLDDAETNRRVDEQSGRKMHHDGTRAVYVVTPSL
ncbi:lipid A biosynthesis lauroyl acyltransferase [Escherichia coli]|uniref:Lipid A biosynthesis lauroyl acyltransferase n=1 Tax=Escherichia coli TaxID=562 RepID=A0A376TII0_ECOLX|nr:lipid A biosynthesis lauroyl acyltransferase [Escherichia coli]